MWLLKQQEQVSQGPVCASVYASVYASVCVFPVPHCQGKDDAWCQVLQLIMAVSAQSGWLDDWD